MKTGIDITMEKFAKSFSKARMDLSIYKQNELAHAAWQVFIQDQSPEKFVTIKVAMLAMHDQVSRYEVAINRAERTFCKEFDEAEQVSAAAKELTEIFSAKVAAAGATNYYSGE